MSMKCICTCVRYLYKEIKFKLTMDQPWFNVIWRWIKVDTMLIQRCMPSGQKIKIKVSHKLIAIGAVGFRIRLHLGHNKWKAEPIPLFPLPYPSLIGRRYPLTARLTDRVFQFSHGENQPRTHDLTATFCTITKPLLPLDYGALVGRFI